MSQSVTLTVTARVKAKSMKAARAKLACHLRRLTKATYSLFPAHREDVVDDFLVQDSEASLERSWGHPMSRSFTKAGPDFPPDRHVLLTLNVRVARPTEAETMSGLKSELLMLADDIEYEDLLGQQGGRDTADIFWEIIDPTDLLGEERGGEDEESVDHLPQAALDAAFQRHISKQQHMVEELGLVAQPLATGEPLVDYDLKPARLTLQETIVPNGSVGLDGEPARLLFGMTVRVSGSSPDRLQAQFARNFRLVSTAITGGLHSGEWVGMENNEIEHARAAWEIHTMPDPTRVPDYVPTLQALQQTKFEHTAVMTLTMEDPDVTPADGIAHIAAELLRLSKSFACAMLMNGFTGPGDHVKTYSYSIRH